MSFILDQLKKSGKKREVELALRPREGNSGRETQGAAYAGYRPAPARWGHMRDLRLVLLAAVLFFAFAGYVIFRGNPDAPQAPAAAGEGKTGTVATSVPAVSAGPAKGLSSGRADLLTAMSRSGADPEEGPAPEQKMAGRKVKNSIPPAAGGESLNQPFADQEAASTAAQSDISLSQDDAGRTPSLNEIPTSLRKALPPLHITSHLYRGSSRLVSINGSIMSEGAAMDRGLILEEITPEGVILSFRGYRFRVRAD